MQAPAAPEAKEKAPATKVEATKAQTPATAKAETPTAAPELDVAREIARSEVLRMKELNAFYRNKVRTASVVDEPLTAAPSSLASKPFVDEDWNQDDPFREFGSLSMQWHTGVSS